MKQALRTVSALIFIVAMIANAATARERIDNDATLFLPEGHALIQTTVIDEITGIPSAEEMHAPGDRLHDEAFADIGGDILANTWEGSNRILVINELGIREFDYEERQEALDQAQYVIDVEFTHLYFASGRRGIDYDSTAIYRFRDRESGEVLYEAEESANGRQGWWVNPARALSTSYAARPRDDFETMYTQVQALGKVTREPLKAFLVEMAQELFPYERVEPTVAERRRSRMRENPYDRRTR